MQPLYATSLRSLVLFLAALCGLCAANATAQSNPPQEFVEYDLSENGETVGEIRFESTPHPELGVGFHYVEIELEHEESTLVFELLARFVGDNYELLNPFSPVPGQPIGWGKLDPPVGGGLDVKLGPTLLQGSYKLSNPRVVKQ